MKREKKIVKVIIKKIINNLNQNNKTIMISKFNIHNRIESKEKERVRTRLREKNGDVKRQER